MPTAWRIVRRARAAEAFSGEGARLFGGRWNSPGTALIYTSETLSLAALETLVHINPRLPIDHVCFEITFDSSLVESLVDVPAGWNRHPPPPVVQRIGNLWASERRSAILSVPSVLVPSERNFLLNPLHRDFGRIRRGPMHPFPFDPRLTSHAT